MFTNLWHRKGGAERGKHGKSGLHLGLVGSLLAAAIVKGCLALQGQSKRALMVFMS